MSLKEFLHEERLERKRIRAELKQGKKQPRTTREKVYKIVSIIFVIAVVCGSLIFACNNMSGGYDWNAITGITEEVKSKLERNVDVTALLGDMAITNDDVLSCRAKFINSGVDFDKIDGKEKVIPSDSIELNSREAGVLAKDILSDLDNSQKIEILGLKIYNELQIMYQKSVIKVKLSDYITNANLPDIYLTSISKCEIQDKQITALNYSTTINDLSLEESAEILEILNRNVITTNFQKLGNDNVNMSFNIVNALMDTKLEIYSDIIKFVI